MVIQAQSEKKSPGVPPKGEMAGFNLLYEFEKGVPHIGDYSFYKKTYLSDPVVQTNINIPCLYTFKNGWLVEGTNTKAKKIVEEYLEKVGFNQKGYTWLKDSKVFGMGYFEYTPDDLYIRNPDKIFVKLDRRGDVVGWEQVSMFEDEPIEFEPDEIIYFANNAFSDSFYGVSDIEVVRYVIRFLKDQAERDIGAMLNKYAGTRYIVTGGTETDPFDTPELTILQEYFSNITFASDVIIGGNVKVDNTPAANHAFDFKGYLDYILLELSQGMRVPIVFWEGKNSTNATAEVQLKVFESYVKSLQTNLEDALNTQLIPNLMRDFMNNEIEPSEYPKIKFHDISLDDVFLQAKTDLIYLQQQVISPEEVRKRQGLDLRFNPADAPKEQGTNITGATEKPDAEKEVNKATGAKLSEDNKLAGKKLTQMVAGVDVLDMMMESDAK